MFSVLLILIDELSWYVYTRSEYTLHVQSLYVYVCTQFFFKFSLIDFYGAMVDSFFLNNTFLLRIRYLYFEMNYGAITYG